MRYALSFKDCMSWAVTYITESTDNDVLNTEKGKFNY